MPALPLLAPLRPPLPLLLAFPLPLPDEGLIIGLGIQVGSPEATVATEGLTVGRKVVGALVGTRVSGGAVGASDG